MWRIWWVPNNASKWQMGLNSAFKGLNTISIKFKLDRTTNKTIWFGGILSSLIPLTSISPYGSVRRYINEDRPQSIQQVWISREPVAWSWCNLGASQRRPYCASENSHSLVGLVSRQWDAVHWACVLCVTVAFTMTERTDRRSCFNAPAHSTALMQTFRQNITSPRSVSTPTAWIWLPASSGFFFPKLKSSLKVRRFVSATVTQYTSSVNGVSLPTD